MKVPPYAERLKWFHQARFGMFIHVLSGLPGTPPEPITVVEVVFSGEPHRMNEADSAAWLTGAAK